MTECRIVLSRGKQKELIETVRTRFKGWKDFSAELGVSEHYLLYELRNETRTLQEKTYIKLCTLAGRNYDKDIVRKLDENWGRRKGAELSPRTKVKEVDRINPSQELAEIIGIVLGDGNIYQEQYALRICGSLIDERDYLTVHVKGLIKEVFGVEPKIYYHRRMNEIILYAYSKFVVENLEYYGMKPGDKLKNNVRIPEWIMRERKYIIPCLRGLFDTDGCVFKSKGNVRIELYSAIPELRISVQNAMKKIGFCSSWKTKKGRRTQTYGLYSASDVERFINVVGFNNPKYRMRASVV